jgi:hypothetical protein
MTVGRLCNLVDEARSRLAVAACDPLERATLDALELSNIVGHLGVVLRVLDSLPRGAPVATPTASAGHVT